MTSAVVQGAVKRRFTLDWWRAMDGIERRRALRMLVCFLAPFTIIIVCSIVGDSGLIANVESRYQPPAFNWPLGTDWLGRGMCTRVLLGLRLSLLVGFVATITSAVLGIILGIASGYFGRVVDRFVGWLIDLVMSLPHLVFQILIAFVAGGGVTGVILAVALTHWASLARVVRAEVQQLSNSEYVQLSRQMGRSELWISRHHLLPHLWPQFLVALLLMFPHAISHEAALSFIGLGLSLHMPSMGIILAESLRHLSTGYWWLAVFPGVALLLTVKVFDILAEDVRALATPRMRQG